VKGFDECLYLYPTEYWDRYTDEHIESRPDEDADAMDMKFLFYSSTCECDIDKQGRIHIPDDFIDHAGVTKEMVNIGYKNRVQIWSKENFDVKMGTIGSKGKEIFGKMGKYVPKP
jgi:MraZ protein